MGWPGAELGAEPGADSDGERGIEPAFEVLPGALPEVPLVVPREALLDMLAEMFRFYKRLLNNHDDAHARLGQPQGVSSPSAPPPAPLLGSPFLARPQAARQSFAELWEPGRHRSCHNN